MDDCRPLTPEEYTLVRWMLEHGSPEAADYLEQLELAEVTSWRCGCGCASINFRIRGRSEPAPGMRVIADFVFGEGRDESGIILYQCEGTLRGLEVFGYAGDAPQMLPSPQGLRPFPKVNPIAEP